MSILTTDLILYGSANRPTDDSSTTGGAIDATRRPVFTQFTAGAKLSLISDGADTRNVTITGRDSTGAIVSEVVALTGAVEVLSVNTYERIHSVDIASSSGSRTVTAKQGSGGTTIGTIPINEVGFYMNFQRAFSFTSQEDRYEKIYWKNTNGTLTLNSAQVTLTADPAAVIMIGLAASKNDSSTATNRVTAPAGVSFVDDNVAQNVPGGTLEAGSYIGVWVNQELGANAAAQKNSYTTQLSGTTV